MSNVEKPSFEECNKIADYLENHVEHLHRMQDWLQSQDYHRIMSKDNPEHVEEMQKTHERKIQSYKIVIQHLRDCHIEW